MMLACESLEAIQTGDEPHFNPMSKSRTETKRLAPKTEEIRSVSHRVMGSRQSQRKIERSGERRQPKRGHGSQRKKSD